MSQFVAKLFAKIGVNSEVEQQRLLLSIIAKCVIPLLATFELICYYRFYYSYGRTLTLDCFTHFVICVAFDILIIWSHWAARQDPGYMERRHVGLNLDTEPLEDHIPEVHCKKCEALKPALVHHCRVCDRCVFLMDHHCMWTNQCVGYNTIKPFILFLTYVACLCAFGVSQICYLSV